MESIRKLASIIFTDIQGYTALMGQDEASALVMVENFENVMTGRTIEHQGEIVNFYGDGCLSIYPNVINAICCAIQIQSDFQDKYQIPVRIGVHLGEVLIKKGNAYGDSVNVASRIESLGQPGAILLSEDVYQSAREQNKFEFIKLDVFEFKNVAKPLSVYALKGLGLKIPERGSLTGKLKDKEDKGKTIVVLPFENCTANEKDDYIVVGISDEIRSQLISIDSLKVISRSSSVNYKHKSFTADQLAKELSVSYALEGQVQFLGDTLRVKAELTNVITKKQVWTSPPITKKLQDVFEIQNLIAKIVIEELKIFLSNENRIQLGKIPTSNLHAYESYQKGMELIHRGNGILEELEQAVKYFKQATLMDPEFAKAYLGLAEAYLEHIFWGRTATKEVIEPASEAANKALELDDETGEVYGVLGAIEYHRFHINIAQDYLEKSIEKSPNFLLSYEKMAWIHVFNKRYEKAIESFKKAIDLDPLSLKFMGDIGHCYYYGRNFEEGLKFIDEQLHQHDNDPWLLWMKGFLYSGNEQYEEAVKTYLSRETSGKRTNWMLAYCLGRLGKTKEARAILDYHLNKLNFIYVPAYMIATMFSGLRLDDETIHWLQKDLEEGGLGHFFVNLRYDPKFLHLHGRQDFKDLLDAVNQKF